MANLSVVIPLAPGERAWVELKADLGSLAKGTEVIFVLPSPEPGPGGPGQEPEDLAEELCRGLDDYRCRVIRAPTGRAYQLNHGARAAKGTWVWFVHADSRLDRDAALVLERKLEEARGTRPRLFYFDLRFQVGGPSLLILNTLGVYLRSRVFGLPFGDQGFCLRRDDFFAVGGYPEEEDYGEDHVFVWQAKRYGIPAEAVGAWMITSPRKYAGKGWARTTALHLYLTARQAISQWLGRRSDGASPASRERRRAGR